jgi:hypothetical protein
VTAILCLRAERFLTPSRLSQPEETSESADSLRSQLADQRARETQILTAYKQLRDELRKMQAVQSKEKKTPFLTRPGTSGTINEAPAEQLTPRKLKRLSLPLHDINGMPRALQDLGIGSASDRPESAASHPPSALFRNHLSFASTLSGSARSQSSPTESEKEEAEIVLSPQEATIREVDERYGLSRPPMTA